MCVTPPNHLQLYSTIRTETTEKKKMPTKSFKSSVPHTKFSLILLSEPSIMLAVYSIRAASHAPLE